MTNTMADYMNPFDIEQAGTKNPCLFVKWKGAEGIFAHNKKNDDGENEKVSLGKSIFIVPMVKFVTVSGWCDSQDAGIRCNEVSKGTDVLNVTAGGIDIASGTWKEIKAKVEADGGKYTVRIYAMMMAKGEDSRMIALDLAGSGLKHWFNTKVPFKMGTLLKLSCEAEAQKKGSVTFYSPMIEDKGEKGETKADAMKLWPPVGQYLNDRENGVQEEAKQTTVPASSPLANFDPENETDELPF